MFSVDDVSTATASLKMGKACAEDGLNAEMLKALSRECLLLLACAFLARASGDAHEPVSWHLLSAVLIPKGPRISSRKKLRPITILPVLKKLYSNLLLTRVTIDLVNSLSHWNMGCRRGYQALEVISILRWLSERHSEWKMPFYVGKPDFKESFRCAQPPLTGNPSTKMWGPGRVHPCNHERDLRQQNLFQVP